MSLADLIAKQKQQKEAQPNVQSTEPASQDSNVGDDSTAADRINSGPGDDASQSESVQGGVPESAQPAAKVGFRFGGKGATAAAGTEREPSSLPEESPDVASTAVAQRFARFNGAGTQASVSGTAGGGDTESGSDDMALGGMDGNTANAVQVTVSRFADEVPAQAPVRVTEGLEEQQLGFIKILDSLYEFLHEPELLGNVIKNMMLELEQHPEYRKLIAPLDVRTMIRGARESMGMARIKKQEKKRSTGSSGGNRSKAVKHVSPELLASIDALADLDF